jgi:hypothetical protein
VCVTAADSEQSEQLEHDGIPLMHEMREMHDMHDMHDMHASLSVCSAACDTHGRVASDETHKEQETHATDGG